MRVFDIPRPYVLFVGDISEPLDAKTALGIFEWRREWCVGQVRFNDGVYDLGLPDVDYKEAVNRGAKTLVIGGAPFGGRLPQAWEEAMHAALDAGLNVASGLHDRLNARPSMVARASERGCSLFDVRGAPEGFVPPVASGARRTGKRVLTVGTDCAIGKKYTALSLERDLRTRGIAATFRATGQTGIFISGRGIAIDAVVADFLAGTVELLSPDNEPGHWDVIEGQGSLFHPAYAAVSLGLLHGSQPDAIVVCHEPTRRFVDGYASFPLPSLERCIGHHLECARLTSPDVVCAGISLNTSHLLERDRAGVLAEVEQRLGLPCVDPAVTDTGKIIDQLVGARSAAKALGLGA